MGFLKGEIEKKKRALEQTVKLATVASSSSATSTNDRNGDDSHATKYIRRGDLERIRVEQERQAQLEREHQREQRLIGAAKKAARMEQDQGESLATSSTTGETNVEPSKPEAFNVSNEEAVRRLRQKQQPVRLFGESDKERRLRLRALELIEERSEGQRNDFMKVMHTVDTGMNLQDVADKIGGEGRATAASPKKKDKKSTEDDPGEQGPQIDHKGDEQDKVPNPKDEEVVVDVSLVKTNPHKVYPQIYHALKRVLKEWEQSLADRPEAVRRSTQGRMAAATHQTSAEYLKPLFKSLRKRDLAPDVLQAIAEITYNMQMREYLRANDAYLRLSIGNAPWPIGVTMVGIHERSGREKIFSNNVAHVLNDETSRKYIQSLKRLLTFAQTVRPPSDLSQIMG